VCLWHLIPRKRTAMACVAASSNSAHRMLWRQKTLGDTEKPEQKYAICDAGCAGACSMLQLPCIRASYGRDASHTWLCLSSFTHPGPLQQGWQSEIFAECSGVFKMLRVVFVAVRARSLSLSLSLSRSPSLALAHSSVCLSFYFSICNNA
jgi:hypothetical protein